MKKKRLDINKKKWVLRFLWVLWMLLMFAVFIALPASRATNIVLTLTPAMQDYRSYIFALFCLIIIFFIISVLEVIVHILEQYTENTEKFFKKYLILILKVIINVLILGNLSTVLRKSNIIKTKIQLQLFKVGIFLILVVFAVFEIFADLGVCSEFYRLHIYDLARALGFVVVCDRAASNICKLIDYRRKKKKANPESIIK